MTRRSCLLATAAVVIVCVGLALAASGGNLALKPRALIEGDGSRPVPSTVWFQGFLADAGTGDPVNATYDVQAAIYGVENGGSPIWGPESHPATPIVEGWFNIELGSLVSPLPSFDAPPYYLELRVDGETLDPRMKLGSVPSALRASAAEAELTLPYSGTVESSMDAAFAVTNTGTSSAGLFEVSNVASGAAAVSGRHDGDGPAVLGWSDGPGTAIVGHAGSGLAGVFEGSVAVSETLATAGFMMPTGAEEGYVLTCDDEWGSGTWRPPSWPELPYEGSLTTTDSYLNPAFEVVFDGNHPNNWAIGGINISDSDVIRTGIVGAAQVMAPGANRGIVGTAAFGPESNAGVLGEAIGSGDEGTSMGGYFYAIGAMDNYGGYFAGFGGPGVNYAGYFEDDVEVIGYLYKTGGGFRIDHPLDPFEKYLQHSFVESPDMKNVYDGIVALDGGGEAWVELPDWFEAINREFRYQLTCIGSYAPVYVAEEVSGNRFRIAGGEPGMKVSWQVTGIRHDPAAEHRRIAVEVEKPAPERGRYRYPEAYGLPRTRAEIPGGELAREIRTP